MTQEFLLFSRLLPIDVNKHVILYEHYDNHKVSFFATSNRYPSAVFPHLMKFQGSMKCFQEWGGWTSYYTLWQMCTFPSPNLTTATNKHAQRINKWIKQLNIKSQSISDNNGVLNIWGHEMVNMGNTRWIPLYLISRLCIEWIWYTWRWLFVYFSKICFHKIFCGCFSKQYDWIRC